MGCIDHKPPWLSPIILASKSPLPKMQNVVVKNTATCRHNMKFHTLRSVAPPKLNIAPEKWWDWKTSLSYSEGDCSRGYVEPREGRLKRYRQAVALENFGVFPSSKYHWDLPSLLKKCKLDWDYGWVGVRCSIQATRMYKNSVDNGISTTNLNWCVCWIPEPSTVSPSL